MERVSLLSGADWHKLQNAPRWTDLLAIEPDNGLS